MSAGWSSTPSPQAGEPIGWRGVSDRTDRGRSGRSGLLGDDPGDDPVADGGPSRWRSVAAVVGFVAIGVFVVSIVGGDGRSAETGDVVTTLPTDESSEDTAGDRTGEPTDGPGAASDSPEQPPIDGGLRYGGAGGGADIRSGDSAGTLRSTAVPLIDLSGAPRLTEGLDPAWETPIDLGGATVSGDLNREVDLAVDADTIAFVVDLDDRHLVVGLDLDGRERWRRELVADSVALLGVVDEAVALGIDGRDEDAVRLLHTDDGADLDDADSVDAAISDLRARRATTVELDAETIDPASIRIADDVDDVTRSRVARVVGGVESIRAVDEVAEGRLVLLAGFRLLGAEVSGDELIVDWSQPGVMLGSSPSDRGATLLVSDRRGAFQYAVDAASGATIAEVSGLPSSIDVYTPVADGMVVKRPAPVGSSLVAIDLDGVERWQLLGRPPFAVGDGLLITVSASPDGLVLTGRR